MALKHNPEKDSKTLGIMTLLPKQRINVNTSSVPSCKKILVIFLATSLFIGAFYAFKHYNAKGHHHRAKHRVGRPHHVGHGSGTDGKGKIRQAIDANLEQIKSRAGNIYLDNEVVALKNHQEVVKPHDDDHEDDAYGEEDDDEYDDDDDEDDDDEDEKEHKTNDAPK
ncbi:uncharacterized protein LOC135212797 isoform X2 [Macrobrachium nipponense]|uniref:uncharacterized protein LOC135212797 isoform X2 n=1 Tax=Macrobrachium nipponense TaxID=159736 RepID=UPI0030C890C0